MKKWTYDIRFKKYLEFFHQYEIPEESCWVPPWDTCVPLYNFPAKIVQTFVERSWIDLPGISLRRHLEIRQNFYQNRCPCNIIFHFNKPRKTKLVCICVIIAAVKWVTATRSRSLLSLSISRLKSAIEKPRLLPIYCLKSNDDNNL